MDECEEDIEIEELLDLYHKLTEEDVKYIVASEEIMRKINELGQSFEGFGRAVAPDQKDAIK